jgi:hypothetical protein
MLHSTASICILPWQQGAGLAGLGLDRIATPHCTAQGGWSSFPTRSPAAATCWSAALLPWSQAMSRPSRSNQSLDSSTASGYLRASRPHPSPPLPPAAGHDLLWLANDRRDQHIATVTGNDPGQPKGLEDAVGNRKAEGGRERGREGGREGGGREIQGGAGGIERERKRGRESDRVGGGVRESAPQQAVRRIEQ